MSCMSVRMSAVYNDDVGPDIRDPCVGLVLFLCNVRLGMWLLGVWLRRMPSI
jgi:hypothetical protein